MIWVMVALGGAFGAMARYGIGGIVGSAAVTGFPWATFVVNVAGCLGLGVVIRWTDAAAIPESVRALLTVGFFGAFTTFSTFGYETVALLRDGAWTRAGAYVSGSVALGILALLAGLWIGRVTWLR